MVATFVTMMQSNLQSFTIQNEPLFKKALEINGLVKSVVKSRASSQTIFELRNSPLASERCLDALQLSALQLPSSIAQAAVTADYQKKVWFKKRILQMTEDLEVYCNVMKRNKIKLKGLNKLRRAIKDFGNLRHNWEIQITSQN